MGRTPLFGPTRRSFRPGPGVAVLRPAISRNRHSAGVSLKYFVAGVGRGTRGRSVLRRETLSMTRTALATLTALAALTLAGPARTQTARAVLQGHRGGVLSLAFGPDGRVLFSASRDGSVSTWNV